MRYGSRLYGTFLPDSDWDYRGVVLPPLEVLLDPFMKFNIQDSGFEEDDKALYNLAKFFELCAQANPNIVELLFVPEEYTTFDSEVWQKVKANRHLFLSKKIKHTFTGYAMSQLKALQRHREWFLNPPKTMPTRQEFGLSESPSVSMAWLNSLKDTMNYDLLRPEVVDEVRRKREYRDAKRKWDNFVQWKTTRNPKRRGTEEQFGYDCYSNDTEFLTNRGWMLYNDVLETDMLGTVNQKTKTIEFQPYTNRYFYTINAEMIEIDTQDTRCLVTLNHRLFVSKCHRNIKTNFSRKYSEEASNWIFLPAEKYMEGYASEYNVLNYTNNKNEEYLDVSDEYLRLIGLYVSEGALLKRRNKTKTILKGISISQLESPNKIKDEIFEISKSYNICTYRHFRKNRYEMIYNIYDKELAYKIYLDCGEYSSEKHLPNWINKLSKRQCMILLNAAMKGDGTKHKHNEVYYTKSKALADSMQILGLLCEKECKVRFYKYEYQTGIYQVYFSNFYGQYGCLNKKKVRKVPYNGNVVCFEVPNSVLITRNNGKMAFHGNSKYASHIFRLMNEGIELLMTGEIVFPLKYADWLLDIKNGRYSYEQIVEMANTMDADFEAYYNATSLPKSPDINALKELYYSIVLE